MTDAVHSSAKNTPKRAFAVRLVTGLRLNSCRGRFAYVLVIAAAFMLATAWVTEKHVAKTTQMGVFETSEHQETSRVLRSTANEVWAADMALRDLSATDMRRRADSLKRINHAIAQSGALPNIAKSRHTPTMESSTRDLLAGLQRLQEEVARPADARISYEKWHFRLMPHFEQVWGALHAMEDSMAADATEDMNNLAQDVTMPGMSPKKNAARKMS